MWSLTPDWNQLACLLNEGLSYSEPSVFFLREKIFGWVEIDAEEMSGGRGEGDLLLQGSLRKPGS